METTDAAIRQQARREMADEVQRAHGPTDPLTRLYRHAVQYQRDPSAADVIAAVRRRLFRVIPGSPHDHGPARESP